MYRWLTENHEISDTSTLSWACFSASLTGITLFFWGFFFLPRADAETYKERNKYDQDREHDNTYRYQCISHNLHTGIFGRMQILIPVSFV